MKKEAYIVLGAVLIIILGYYFLFSQPKEEPKTTDISKTINIPVTQSYNPPDEETAKLYSLWKQRLFEQSGITEEYFNEHFEVISTYRNPAISAPFFIVYNFTIDWLEITHSDEFLQTRDFDGLPLNESQIKVPVSFTHQISSIISEKELETKIKSCDSRFNYNKSDVYNFLNWYPNGNITASPRITINETSNKCKTAEVNLETGSLSCIDIPCFIER